VRYESELKAFVPFQKVTPPPAPEPESKEVLNTVLVPVMEVPLKYIRALVAGAVEVLVPPFAIGIAPVKENVVLPFVVVDVTLPEPRMLK